VRPNRGAGSGVDARGRAEASGHVPSLYLLVRITLIPWPRRFEMSKRFVAEIRGEISSAGAAATAVAHDKAREPLGRCTA